MLRVLGAASLAAATAAVGLAAPAAGATEEGYTLSVFHHNDAESAIIADGDFGGAARFVNATWRYRAEAEQAGNATLMVNAGDSFLASPEWAANPSYWFYDSIYQQMVNYDVMGIGNHEFDFGPDVFATFIKGFTAGDATPPFVSANLDFSGVPSLQAYVDQGVLAPSTVVEKDGERIGVIGATTPLLDAISSPGDVEVGDVVPAVQAEIDALTADGVEIIILVSHLQSLNNDIEVVSQLSGLDAAIGGGGDQLQANEGDLLLPDDEADPEFPYPLVVADADGDEVPVVSGPGEMNYLGELVLTFDADGEVTNVGGQPHRVSGIEPELITPHPTVEALVEAPIAEFVAELEAEVIGSSDVDLNGQREPGIRTQETGLGDLIADSLLWQANQLAADAGVGEADIALQNGGGIRNDSVIPAGPITALTTFDILPFANFVTVVEGVEPETLVEILENAYSAVEDVDGRFAQIAGFSVVYDPSAQAREVDEDGNVLTDGERIVSVTLDDGTAIVADGEIVDGAPAVNIATIDFLARGGDQYPFGEDATFSLLATSYQQALANYIVDGLGGTISAADYPVDGAGRITTG
ncbi:MAG: bifunctional metallophosphatase/5'-nucleotidase [Actinomycetota bacterium]|nr:bifunctional metallophosphatase/5'-nucleotidase [Actinomycetota bacterium]